MGGDDAPRALLRGAIRACSPDQEKPLPPDRILLVGDEDRIAEGLEEAGTDPGFTVVHATQVV